MELYIPACSSLQMEFKFVKYRSSRGPAVQLTNVVFEPNKLSTTGSEIIPLKERKSYKEFTVKAKIPSQSGKEISVNDEF